MPKDPAQALREMSSVEIPAPGESLSPAATLMRKIKLRSHAILAGPPGTGKTKLVLDAREQLQSEGKLGIFFMTQFHREYSYQDFIDGFDATDKGFVKKPGLFRRFIDAVENRGQSKDDSEKVDILMIDEMNRADVSSVFGELLTLLDDSDRKPLTLARSGESLILPSSVVIVGTMNTADKSIALLDFALRRRFAFLFVPPDYPALQAWLTSYGFDFDDFTIDDYVKSARVLNARISLHPLLGKSMMMGQSLFVPKLRIPHPLTLDQIVENLVEQVFPQLEAYLGFGTQKELDKLIGIEIRRKIESAITITHADIIGLIRVLADDKDLSAT